MEIIICIPQLTFIESNDLVCGYCVKNKYSEKSCSKFLLDFLKSGECADNLNTFFLIVPNTEGYNSDKLKS